MPVYKFVVDTPVTDTLPRNRVANALHFNHLVGGQSDEDLEAMCADLVELYQARYNKPAAEWRCKAYDTDAKPNYPRATVIVNPGIPHIVDNVREVALVLSYAGNNKGNKSERGRCYLMPQLGWAAGAAYGLRPTAAHLDWALDWYTEPNASFPDIGGVDWEFGIYSKTYQKFTKAQQAWVNDEWDTQRRRGLRETTRVNAIREG